MRIISGTAKGTKLYTLEGINTRPTLDRVKESVFNIIFNKINDAIVLDLFAGSGAIGLEFASRGAKKIVLCDNSKKACEVINKNIEKTHLKHKVQLYNCEYVELIEKIRNMAFDIIYLDPPYNTDYVINSLTKMLNNNIINRNTLIIVETDNEERIINQIEENGQLEIVNKRKYGRACILFLKRRNGKGEG